MTLLLSALWSDPTKTSTLLLTALMVIGLIFFIRASTKDRIEVMRFGADDNPEVLQQKVLGYFQSRAYRQIEETENVDESPAIAQETITVAGMVSPSWFMAIFLSLLAAVGFACLGLIVATIVPSLGQVVFAVVALSPLAGVFYWKKSARPERVVFAVESSGNQQFRSKLIVQGHRDELAELQKSLAQLSSWPA